MRVLIVDDHQLFIDGLRHIVALLDDHVEILEANNASQAITAIQQSPDIDMIMLDLHLPGSNGLSTLQMIRNTNQPIPVVIISGEEDRQTIESVLQKGVMGFIPKSYSRNKMLLALNLILDGEVYFPGKLKADEPNEEDTLMSRGIAPIHITQRQQQVLNLLAQGYTNKTICRELNLTSNTVKTHLRALFDALQVSNRTECVRVAREKGLIV